MCVDVHTHVWFVCNACGLCVLYVCLLLCVYAYTCIHVYLHTYGPEIDVGCLPILYLLYVLKQGISLNLELTHPSACAFPVIGLEVLAFMSCFLVGPGSQLMLTW